MRNTYLGLPSVSDIIDRGINAGKDLLGDTINEGSAQGVVLAQLELLDDKVAPHYTLNADYVYCEEDPTDDAKCESVAWFPRLEQFDFPKTTKLNELNNLLAKVGINQKLTVLNTDVLRKLRARMFYDTANTYKLLDVTEPEALDIAKKGFSRVDSARNVKIKDKNYRREQVLGLTPKLSNAVDIIDEKGSPSYGRMLEKMSAIEDAFLNFPSFKTNLLSLPLAKHLAAKVGLDFSIPRLKIYLNPDHTEFVEYIDAQKQIKVKTKDVNETISAESAILKPEELAKITPATPATFAGGSGSSSVTESSWYKTWWGISLIGATAAGSAYMIYKHSQKKKSHL